MPIDIFVPSFNAYDLNTISALETVGFKLLSAGGGVDHARRTQRYCICLALPTPNMLGVL